MPLDRCSEDKEAEAGAARRDTVEKVIGESRRPRIDRPSRCVHSVRQRAGPPKRKQVAEWATQ